MMSELLKEQVWIRDEVSGASVTEREIRIPNEVIEKVLTKALQAKLDRLEKQVEILQQQQELCVQRIDAKKIVTETLSAFKSSGITEIDVIDLHNKTHLPISQINDIMNELESEGAVTASGESD